MTENHSFRELPELFEKLPGISTTYGNYEGIYDTGVRILNVIFSPVSCILSTISHFLQDKLQDFP